MVENLPAMQECVLVTQSCPALCDTMDCSPPGSSVHGIFQATMLKCIVISYSRGSSWPSDWTWFSWVSCIGRWILYHWATKEALHSFFKYIFRIEVWLIYNVILISAVQELKEMQVWSLGWEDPLEEGTATHSSILAWKIPWTEEPGRPQSSGSLRVRRYWGDFSCMASKIKRLVHNQWRVKRVALSSEEGSALIGGSCPGCYQQGCILMEHVLNKRKITIVFQCIYMESRKMVLKNSFTGQQWRNRLVPNRKRSTSRLCTVTLLMLI